MNILINGQLAAIKKGSSFDYVSENRYFTDADGYSLSIELPLKNCPQNIAIFGHINRKDNRPPEDLMLCELRDGSFYKRGSIAITEINEISVKVQFLEGRSIQNCSPEFDTLYINELQIGYNTYEDSHEGTLVVDSYSWPVDNLANTLDDGQEWQALPWVNNYSGNIQNDINLQQNTYKMQKLSYQCYLLALTKRIFQAVGYQCDFLQWEQSDYRHLLCCNTLPAAWEFYNYAMALPHWTVTEYIEQLEKLMYCEFDINHTDKQIRMQFSATAMLQAPKVQLDNVLDTYTVTEEEEETCSYKEANNLRFASCSHAIWKYYDCQWFIDKHRPSGTRFPIRTLATLQELFTQIPAQQNASGTSEEDCCAPAESVVYYVEEVNRYYTGRRISVTTVKDPQPPSQTMPGTLGVYNVQLLIQPLNTFAPYIYDEKANTAELSIVPAWLDDLGKPQDGYLYFLDCGELDNITASRVALALEEGQDEPAVFHDKIYVGFWSGGVVDLKYPHPYIDSIDINTDRTLTRHAQTLALRDEASVAYVQGSELKRGRKYTFKFLSNFLPNIRSVFYIHGKRYLCEKITATFTDNGMSQLMTGVFYEIKD